MIACLLLAAAFAEPPMAEAWEPTSAYAVQDLRGWRVLVNKGFRGRQPGLCERTLIHLEDHLHRIAHRLPGPAVEQLRRTPIWVEEAHPKHPCMCYHPGADWLRRNGMNPEKAGGVELANATAFLEWTKAQPWMVLHELAHGYHDRVVPQGYANPELAAALAAARTAGTYDRVLHINGQERRHYALTNQQEYFAEATEAYFGANDFHPFVQAELRRHDPAAFSLMKKLWADPAPPVAAPKPASK
jgi:hypothetical protein